jgi:indole-3-glycerol phosphate synthase
MSDFLKEMARSSAARAAQAPSFTDADFDKPIVPLNPGPFGIIAEIKNRSPAEGQLRVQLPYTESKGSSYLFSRARAYAAGGAAAISVLTEPDRFDGALAHLAEVVAAVPNTPVMRKDFLVAPVQVLEARAAGASGVLLITTMLDDDDLNAMLDCAFEHGMFVLLESFDEDDLRRSTRYLDRDGQLLIGVNTRNLRTLAVDGDRLQRFSSLLPDASCVAESGLREAADAARVADWGYTMALVGTALMRSEDPAALIAAMQSAGAAACS